MSGKKGKSKSKSTGRKKKKAARKQDKLPPIPSSEAIEGSMFNFFGGGNTGAVAKAQDIMYEAWDSSTKKKRLELARKALEVSPDCADAYVMIAEESVKSVEEAIELFQKGVEAGERALGKKTFKEDIGYFWGLLETRPYMRAKAGLALALWRFDEREKAVAQYWDMLRLNPDDNQGIRDLLMPCLIEMGLDADAEKLFKKYEDDGMAVWMYSRALLDFRKNGDSPEARNSLKAALEENKHVPEYILRRKKRPQDLPDFYGFGDENEAILYAYGNREAWLGTPGALDWLAANVS